MAQYSVTRSCGHTETVNLIGKHRDREWRLENVEPHKTCRACYEAELAHKKAKATAEAIEAAKEMELPELAGTEKQIAWAETIRQKILSRVDGIMNVKSTDEREALLPGLDELQQIESARWWIDHRDIAPRDLEKLMLKTAKVQEEKPLADAAKLEATVRPENQITETVAEIRSLEGRVEVYFPEKREDFREIVRDFGMEWTGLCWRRRVKAHNGTVGARSSELGHKLLATGFIVRIYDDDVRRQAIDGMYEQEHTRWVLCRTGGDHLGWLALVWSRQEDFYRAARGINGSRYDKPSVIVPPEYYDEVLDFAEMYDFRISERAQEAIGQARQARESMLVVKVTAPVEREKVTVSGKPPVLEVPESVEIDDEFRD